MSLLFSQDVAGIRGGVAGRISSWKAKPAEVDKAPAPAPEPEPEPAKPAVSPDYSWLLYFTSAFPKPLLNGFELCILKINAFS